MVHDHAVRRAQAGVARALAASCVVRLASTSVGCRNTCHVRAGPMALCPKQFHPLLRGGEGGQNENLEFRVII